MPITLCQTDSPRFTGLFPDWEKPRPIRFFLMENLLESRHGSAFPTGSAGFDEDVNVYISHLLADFLGGHNNTQVKMGAWPLLAPPDKSLPLASRVGFYKANADHRLLYLGLMDRGDDLRRRRNPLQNKEQTTRQQDLMVGSTCYGVAANLLQHGPNGKSGLATVLRKLEQHFSEYVQVVATLATRRLHLGAQLSTKDLQGLLDVDHPTGTAPAQVLAPEAANPTCTMDDLLDTMLAQKEQPQPQRQQQIKEMARQLGVPDHLITEKPNLTP